MRAIVFHEHGTVSKLRLEEFPDPTAGSKDVVLRVKATSLNGFDSMILAGTCCVQLAKAVGAEVVAAASAAWKLDTLREIGANHLIDRKVVGKTVIKPGPGGTSDSPLLSERRKIRMQTQARRSGRHRACRLPFRVD
jgi:NADPH:quinone reductase-like Zn-dependent oxidoreductase